MSGIKRYLPTCDCMGQSSLGDYVLCTDHLASHAYDEAVEREAFEVVYPPLAGISFDGEEYMANETQPTIDIVMACHKQDKLLEVWLACAKSRAKRFGGDV